jgi:hypothetical protein
MLSMKYSVRHDHDSGDAEKTRGYGDNPMATNLCKTEVSSLTCCEGMASKKLVDVPWSLSPLMESVFHL